jgi:hypothetical protein
MRGAETAWQNGGPAEQPPGWVQESPAGIEQPPAASLAAPPSGGDPDEGEVPEWLARIRERQADEVGAPEEGSMPDLPEGGLTASRQATEEPESEPLPPLELPDEADEYDSGVFYPPGSPKAGQTPAPAPAPAPTPKEGPLQPGELPPEPSWMSELMPAQAAPASPRPLPHAPALMTGEDLQGPDILGQDVIPEGVGLPEWLGQIKADEAELGSSGDSKADLAPATLPAWLEAMRPVDSFRSGVEIIPEEEQVVEAAGPLAGLRGVLLAEPVVAIPRMAATEASVLEVTERQFAQAELMHRLVEDEEREYSPAPPKRLRVPWTRWMVSVVLLVAAALPTIVGYPVFPLPAKEPLELGTLVNVVAGAPPNRPVLIVIDYEAGGAPEMQAVLEPMLDQMMQQRLSLVMVSTRTAGAILADQALQATGGAYGYINGQDYVNLGYLAGGSTGAQLFAQDPRQAPLAGFSLPLAPDGTTLSSPWQVPMLGNVDELADFGMMAVVSGSGESARMWIEQAEASLGASPLVLLVTAGADPLVRPYYEAQNPQVDAMLAGLPAAVSYSIRVGQPGMAFTLWNAFGLMVVAAEVILLLGGIPAFVTWFDRQRRLRAERP